MTELPSDNTSSSRDEEIQAAERTVGEDETGGSDTGIDRRSLLKLTGSAVATSGFIGTAVAATTRHGITFRRVLNAVEDLGMDPTGTEPVNLGAYIQSNTLIEFPAGTYLIGGRGTTVGISNFGMRGLGSSWRDVQFLPPAGVGQGVLVGGGEGPYLVENMSMNERDDRRSALWFGLASSRGGYMGDVEWLGRSPSDDAAGSDYHINASVFDTGGTWVFENVRAGLDLPSVPQDYPNGISFLRSGPSHRGLAVMRDCVIHERNSTATRWEAGPGVVQMENCEFINNQLASVRVGGGNHPTHNCVIKDCHIFGDGSRRTTAPIEMENGWPNPITLENVHVEWDTTQSLRGVVDSPGYDPCGRIEMRGCVIRNESPNANAIDFSSPPAGLDGTVTIDNCQFTGSGRGIDVDGRPGSTMRNSCFDMPNGSVSGIGTQNVSRSDCQTPGESNTQPSASITLTDLNGLTADLSGADSSDPDGQIATFEWDVGGTAYTGDAVTHTFESSGTYPVSLTVTDDEGNTATASTNVTVDDQRPNELRLEGTGIATNYQFSVSGSLAGTDNSLESWDEFSESTAEGWVTSEEDSDVYRFSGELTDFEYLQGEATVSLNGNEIDPTAPTDPTEQTLEIRGTGTTTNYQFSVSGSLAGTDDSLEAWDDLSESTAEGWVTDSNDADSFEFTGEVTDFTFLQGEATVSLDGEQVSPGDL